jgi:hypothetical protein
MARPDEDAYFLQVKDLSGQALEHPVADPSRKERSDRAERGVKSPLQAESKPAGRNESERCSHVISISRKVFERAEPVMSRRRQETADQDQRVCWTSPGF